MTDSVFQTLIILAVGMITVFLILGMVVLTGQILIRITNYLAEEGAVVAKTKSLSHRPSIAPTYSKHQIDKKKLAAIVATVAAVTNGRGSITKIERVP